MSCASLKRAAIGFFSAAVLGAVPVAAWLAIAPGLLPETYAAISPLRESSAVELSDLPATTSDAGLSATERNEVEAVASASVTLLNAWYYTDHDCASERGRERRRQRGRGHEGQRERSPKGCPPQRGHGR